MLVRGADLPGVGGWLRCGSTPATTSTTGAKLDKLTLVAPPGPMAIPMAYLVANDKLADVADADRGGHLGERRPAQGHGGRRAGRLRHRALQQRGHLLQQGPRAAAAGHLGVEHHLPHHQRPGGRELHRHQGPVAGGVAPGQRARRDVPVPGDQGRASIPRTTSTCATPPTPPRPLSCCWRARWRTPCSPRRWPPRCSCRPRTSRAPAAPGSGLRRGLGRGHRRARRQTRRRCRPPSPGWWPRRPSWTSPK